MVKAADWPAVTVAEAGEAAMLKLGAETVMTVGDDVLARLLTSPEYLAVIETEPAVAKEALKLAVPPERVAVPRVVEPVRKVIVPEGALPCTVAVSVTCCCSFALVCEAVSVVAVAVGAVSTREA